MRHLSARSSVAALLTATIACSDARGLPSADPDPPTAPAPGPVASVTLVPEDATIGLLGTAQFSAVPRDAQGRLLSGRTVWWSVADGLLAGVSPSGLVTALAAGATSVRATAEDVTASAPVTVSLLGAPAQGSWPNLPANFAPLTDENFSGPLAKHWEEWWNDGGGSMIAEPTSPFSPGGVYQMKYDSGYAAGYAPSTLVFKTGVRSLFVGLWWKGNDGWQGHESNVNKIQFLFVEGNGTEGDNLYMAAYGPPGGPYDLSCLLQFRTGDTRTWLRPNVDPGIVTFGGWHRIEWLIQASKPGMSNGVVRWWMDGKLVGDYKNIVFPTPVLDAYKLSPTYGGMGGAKSQTDYFWYDHVFLAWR